MVRDSAKTLSERLSVAMGTAGRDLGAASDRVPARVGPFDVAAVTHVSDLPQNVRSSESPRGGAHLRTPNRQTARARVAAFGRPYKAFDNRTDECQCRAAAA